jgi:hypothetical protein
MLLLTSRPSSVYVNCKGKSKLSLDVLTWLAAITFCWSRCLLVLLSLSPLLRLQAQPSAIPIALRHP